MILSKKLNFYIRLGGIIILISGAIDIWLWSASFHQYYIPSWIVGLFFMCIGIVIYGMSLLKKGEIKENAMST